MTRLRLATAALTLMLLAACDSEANVDVGIGRDAVAGRSGAATPPARTTRTDPLVANGDPTPLSADADPNLQWAASVVKLVPIEDQDAKLFGTAGGDPAMNGLYSYIAFFGGPADGWVSYRIGDFLDFEVLAVGPGQVDLSVDESVLDDASGEIGSRTRRLIVRWTPGADGAPPTEVTVTPAR